MPKAISATTETTIRDILIGLGFDGSETPSKDKLSDIGLDSLDHIEFVMELESKFKLEIPDDDADNIETIAQAAAYVERHKT